MDTEGNIKRFASLQEAEHEGFATQLTQREAEKLVQVPPPERHVELRKVRMKSRSPVAALLAAATVEPQVQTSRKREPSGPSAKALAYKRQRRKRNKAARKARKRGRRS